MANAPWQAICGDWLSHPSGCDTPSNADPESMAAGLVLCDAYVSLIIVPDSYRGASPTHSSRAGTATAWSFSLHQSRTATRGNERETTNFGPYLRRREELGGRGCLGRSSKRSSSLARQSRS